MNLDDIIREKFPHMRTIDLANELGLTYGSVCYKAHRMGLKKSKEYLASETSGRHNLIEAGKAYRFIKDHTPHNKGAKMPEHVYHRVKPTMFKKGNKPHNTQPVGTINFRADKDNRTYAYVKIKDSDWRLMHRVVWEQYNGPIPPGHIVRFKDGNTLHWDISNLEMIDMRNNMNRNTIQRFPVEIQEVIKLNSKLKKKINGTKQNQ
jgi:hypothetical protein